MMNLFQQLFQSKPAPQVRVFADPEQLLNANLTAKLYDGCQVNWILKIQGMFNDFNPNYVVVLAVDGKSSASVWLNIDPNTCPEIYDHGSGSLLRVKGELKTVQENNIYLEKCVVEF